MRRRPGAVLAAVAAAGLAAWLVRGGEAPATPSEATLREAVKLRDRALASIEEGDFEKALAPLGRLEAILPDNLLPPLDRGFCLLKLGRREEAWAALERARALRPESPNALHAMAAVLALDPGSAGRRAALLADFARLHPHDARPLHLQAATRLRDGRAAEAAALLERALGLEPENLVLLADLLVAAATAGDREAVAAAVDALEDRLDGFEGSLASFAADLRRMAGEGGEAAGGMAPAAVVVRNLLRPSELYQAQRVPLEGSVPGGGFPQLDFDPPLPPSIQGGQDLDLAFADDPGLLPGPGLPLAVAATAAGVEAVVADAGVGLALWPLPFAAAEPRVVPAPAGPLAVAAFDADTLPDLVTAVPGQGVALRRGLAGGGFGPAEVVAPLDPGSAVLALEPVDLDHDGDLDLFVGLAGAADLYRENDGSGRFRERAAELGIAGPAEDTAAAALVDLDDDGDLDLVTVGRGRPARLYRNPRAGAFPEAAAAFGLDALAADAEAVVAAELDGDGLFDLVVWGGAGGRFLRARREAGGVRFEPVALPADLVRAWRTAAVADLDNDGDLDLVVGPDGGGLVLVRNRRPGFAAEPLAAGPPAARILPLDADGDGDLDLLVGGEARRLLRNDGGERNHFLRLALVGRLDQSSKNNVEGRFCRLEAKVAGRVETRLGNGRVNHLGLGAEREADVLRVVWTNGIAQLWQKVGADRTLVEEQMLKGSCPFLYTWDGVRFRFHTDLLWPSPLGMVLADGAAAPHAAARDAVLVPGEALRSAGGGLWLQITEELWEAAYLDRLELLAVDHPEAVELVVDERFLPGAPRPESPPLHWLDGAVPPTVARDERGRDVLDRIVRRDEVYVDGLPPGRYQGIRGDHALELTFPGHSDPRSVGARRAVPDPEGTARRAPTGGEASPQGNAGGGSTARLILWGWIFPTDTTVNVALSQGPIRPWGPRLERRRADGSWEELSPFVGFPNGKRKAMVLDLGELDPGPLALRLSTNLEIYWDAAVLVREEPAVRPRITGLAPSLADLHARGFSRLVRDDPSGPHLFDYGAVAVEPRFRDQRGAYTRFGDVVPLLAASDDLTVVMNAGDELTVRFDAEALPPLPPGWRRDYVLATDGWVKDADLHTAASETVGPLPYHAMRAYPDPRPRPADPAYRAWLARYQTRLVDDRDFVERLRR